ncbi:MAG: hypothetical protein IPJ88_06340 [Myxococcales bacterium]|nr:MAG: hypothetical protein IPJ88_06340 [Myxococcales bacterium]
MKSVKFWAIKCLLVMVVLASANGIAFAQVCGSDALRKNTVFFVNGMLNTRADLRASRDYIKNHFSDRLHNKFSGDSFEFISIYNTSYGWVEDLLEVFRQKYEERIGVQISRTEARRLIILLTMHSITREFTKSLWFIPGFWNFLDDRDYIAGFIAHAINRRLNQVADEYNLVYTVKSTLEAGHRVLIIAHSQGNLFSNLAMRDLQQDYGDHLAMVGIASPADRVFGHTAYFTADDDRVIASLALIQPVLKPNVDNDPGLFGDDRDLFNHELITSYMDPTLVSRPLISDAIETQLASVSHPEAILSSGVMSVSLDWSGGGDLDLHVSEPTGEEVFWGNLTGRGILHRDSKDGSRSEYYSLACDELMIGRFSVRVEYYDGEGPRTALLHIRTSDGREHLVSKTLEPGQDMTMAHVVVDKKNGVYRITVEEE